MGEVSSFSLAGCELPEVTFDALGDAMRPTCLF